jgi:hypothetical protein
MLSACFAKIKGMQAEALPETCIDAGLDAQLRQRVTTFPGGSEDNQRTKCKEGSL